MEPTQLPAPIQSTNAVTRAHHKFGPSRMNYLDECAAFTSQSGTNDAAEQGTFLHDLMEQMIKQVIKGKARRTLPQMSDWVTATHELLDDEIAYLRFCCQRIDKYLDKKPTAVHTEISVRVTHEDGTELNHGFLDVLFVFGDMGIVIDFKFGWEPVRPAKTNLQGFNYTLGCFLKFPGLNRIGVEFIQPKLNVTTSHIFQRTEMFALYTRLRDVIDRAEEVQANPAAAHKFLKVGSYCRYCALSGTCTALANHRSVMATTMKQLPTPPSFNGLELSKPEDLALARYWVDVVESGMEEIKKRAFEVAQANDGAITCTLPNGETVTYEISERGAARSLGSAIEVAEALKEIITPAEVLGAAELAITKLEPIVKNAMIEAAATAGQKLTKKAAWEQAQSTLEANGLLSRPDTKIRFLKLKKAVKELKA